MALGVPTALLACTPAKAGAQGDKYPAGDLWAPAFAGVQVGQIPEYQ